MTKQRGEAQGRKKKNIAFQRLRTKSGAASLDEWMEFRNVKGDFLHQACLPFDPPSIPFTPWDFQQLLAVVFVSLLPPSRPQEKKQKSDPFFLPGFGSVLENRP